MRLAGRLKVSRGLAPAIAVIEATKLIEFIESAGLDVVMPDWVPIDEDAPKQERRRLSWDDLPRPSEDWENRKPWRGDA